MEPTVEMKSNSGVHPISPSPALAPAPPRYRCGFAGCLKTYATTDGERARACQTGAGCMYVCGRAYVRARAPLGRTLGIVLVHSVCLLSEARMLFRSVASMY